MSASREKDEGLEDRRKRETALKRVSLLPQGRAKRDIVSLISLSVDLWVSACLKWKMRFCLKSDHFRSALNNFLNVTLGDIMSNFVPKNTEIITDMC